MARQPRLAVAGQPHLILQRGHGARPVFVDDVDRALYLDALVASSRACGVVVHAYALLDDQVLLLATPARAEALGQFMQRVGRRYVPAFNRRHGVQGSPWAGRFHAAALDPERYLLPALRFVEQAPVRAGMVATAADWRWSSAPHHVGRQPSPLVTEQHAYWKLGNTPFEREAKHVHELQQMLTDAEVAELVAAARGGWPLGAPAFVAAVAETTERPLQRRPRGRPPGTAIEH